MELGGVWSLSEWIMGTPNLHGSHLSVTFLPGPSNRSPPATSESTKAFRGDLLVSVPSLDLCGSRFGRSALGPTLRIKDPTCSVKVWFGSNDS